MKRIEKFIELMQHTGMEQHEIKTCPNVLFTHTADMIASKIVGI